MSTGGNRAAAWQALGLGPRWVVREACVADAASPQADAARATWDELRATVAACTRCALCKTRTQTVFGVGSQTAQWMLIGEAPGAEEDARGEPFVGQAGRLLDNMLTAIGLTRKEEEGDAALGNSDDGRQRVYIANVLKCRPPGNRNPEPAEVAQCEPYLQRQIALLRPRIIIVMGRFAAQSLLGTDASIASLRGRTHEVAVGDLRVPAIVTYHPAYLLRNLADKAKAWADLCLAAATFERQT
jgi:DNA polymerase